MNAMLRILPLALAIALAPAAAHASGPAEEAFFDIVLKGLNLVLIAGVIVYFGRDPIRRFFSGRRQTITHDLDQASKLLSDAERKYAEWEQRMAGLDAELAEIRQQTRDMAELERQRILADTVASAERMRRDTAAALEQELRRARAELRAEAADLAVTLAGRLLRDRITPADGEKMIDEFVTKLEQVRGSTSASGEA